MYAGRMKTANIGDAKTQFSALIREVESGETVIIARDGRPIAKIVRIDGGGKRRLGTHAGLGYIADDFDAPLPEDILRAFYGGELPAKRT